MVDGFASRTVANARHMQSQNKGCPIAVPENKRFGVPKSFLELLKRRYYFPNDWRRQRERARIGLGILSLMSLPSTQHAAAKQKGILLEDLTWQEAETYLRRKTFVVIPIGAASKHHGPHLKLKNDWLLAEYVKAEVLKSADVLVAPTVNYNYYPALLEYPGSISPGWVSLSNATYFQS